VADPVVLAEQRTGRHHRVREVVRGRATAERGLVVLILQHDHEHVLDRGRRGPRRRGGGRARTVPWGSRLASGRARAEQQTYDGERSDGRATTGGAQRQSHATTPVKQGIGTAG